jgi:Tat protein secretion system quality control protein TatD with DNase activity
MDKEGSSDAIEKMDTNEPVKVITNVKSIAKYFKIDEIELSKIIYKNSLKAFKLIK